MPLYNEKHLSFKKQRELSAGAEHKSPFKELQCSVCFARQLGMVLGISVRISKGG